jgi:hypothetical protein
MLLLTGLQSAPAILSVQTRKIFVVVILRAYLDTNSRLVASSVTSLGRACSSSYPVHKARLSAQHFRLLLREVLKTAGGATFRLSKLSWRPKRRASVRGARPLVDLLVALLRYPTLTRRALDMADALACMHSLEVASAHAISSDFISQSSSFCLFLQLVKQPHGRLASISAYILSFRLRSAVMTAPAIGHLTIAFLPLSCSKNCSLSF